MGWKKKSLFPWWTLLFVSLFLVSCGPREFDDIDVFEAYIKGDSSPFLQTIERNGVRVSVRYLPTDALMIGSFRRYQQQEERIALDTSLTLDDRDRTLREAQITLNNERESYQKSIYLSLTIGYNDPNRDIVFQHMGNGPGGYSKWLQTLMFGLKDHVYLSSSSVDEVPLSTYHMDRTYGLSKNRTLLLVFPRDFNNESLDEGDLALVLREFGLGVGVLRFDLDVPECEPHFRM